MTSDMYKEEMTEEVAERISTLYIQEFEFLLQKLQ